MAIHLTPTELAREAGLERREVIEKCMEMGVPIFQGRIDKTLFLANLSSRPRAPPHSHALYPPDARQKARRTDARPIQSAPLGARGGAMESSTAVPGHEQCHRVDDDRRPDRAGGRAARRQPRDPPQARRRMARRQLRRARRDRLGGRPRADRPRHRAGRPRRDPLHDAAGVDLRRLRHHARRARSSCRSTPTNSPEECEWVAGNSEARAIVCEDADAGREDPRGRATTCRRWRRSS